MGKYSGFINKVTFTRASHTLVVTFSIISLLAFAACEPTTTETLGPEAWSQAPEEPGPIELVSRFTTATHAGDWGVSTHLASSQEEAPAFCIAYLDGHAREEDTCVVSERPFEWTDGIYPWTVRATWTGLDGWDDQIVARLAVHAFDEQVQPWPTGPAPWLRMRVISRSSGVCYGLQSWAACT
jgi:hypothetical protein